MIKKRKCHPGNFCASKNYPGSRDHMGCQNVYYCEHYLLPLRDQIPGHLLDARKRALRKFRE